MINRLNIKHWLFLLYFTMCIALFHGCGSVWDVQDMAAYGFIESEQVVEVDADTKSFRIVLKWSDEGDRDEEYHGIPRARIDTAKTTARHNVHFINILEPPFFEHIGDFTPMDSDKWYRDVELLPENIKSEKFIYYYVGHSYNHNMIDSLKVILRPKANNN